MKVGFWAWGKEEEEAKLTNSSLGSNPPISPSPVFRTVRKKSLSIIHYTSLPKPSSVYVNQVHKFKVHLSQSEAAWAPLSSDYPPCQLHTMLQSPLCCSNIPHTFNPS